MTTEDAIRAFEDAIRSRGIIPPLGGIVADGKIKRCAVEGTPHKKDGSILLFNDPPMSGGFENWRDGKGWENWTSGGGNGSGSKLSAEEVRAARARQEKIRQARDSERSKRQKEAAAEARKIWEAAGPAISSHPYLTKKKINPNGLRMSGAGNLIVPMTDESGVLVNLQRIDGNGEKRFLPGGKVAGVFSSFGPTPDPSGSIVIVEGVSTGLSVFEAAGLPVVAAMSADNLLTVAKTFRARYPKAKLIIFADNDTQETHGHRRGIEAAEEAAKSTGAYIAISPRPGDDANDLYAREGAVAVRKVVEAARPATTPESEMVETAPRVRENLFENVTVDKIIPPSGFLQAYVDYYSEQTDAPRLYHLVLGYVTVAAILGDRCYFRLAGDKLFPNIWAVVIGPSGIARKSTSLNKSRGSVSAIDPKAIFPPDFTTEALLDLLAANPQGVFYHSEFRSLYGMLSKDYMSGAKALLTELYDSPSEYRRETKGKSIQIHQPVISMASATTTQWLTSRNAEDDFGGGFLARFLFVPVFRRERSMPLPPDPNPRLFHDLQEHLLQIRTKYPTSVEARYVPAAREMFVEWYQQFDSIAPFADTPLAPFHARYQSYVHKLAMLYTVSVGGDVQTMGIDAVTYATATVEFVTKSLLVLYDRHLTFGKADESMKRVIDLIPEKGGIIRSELLKRSRMKMKEFDETILTLLETERITTEPVKGKGRTGCAYRRKGSAG